MKKTKTNGLTTLLLILFTLTTCKVAKKKDQFAGSIMSTSTYYQPSQLIDSMSRIFLDSSKCENCLNELHIDKIYSDEIYFTFTARLFEENYLQKANPLFYFIINGKTIFIFSGVENYILGDQKRIDSFSLTQDKRNIYYLRMQFSQRIDSVSLLPIASDPFFPLIIPAPEEDKNAPIFTP